jgi:YggT family protein
LDQQLIYLFIRGIFTALIWLIFARIILSFLQVVMRIDPYNPIIRFIYETTEPLMAPFRKLIPPLGGIDFSPIILFLVLQIVENILIKLVGMFF